MVGHHPDILGDFGASKSMLEARSTRPYVHVLADLFRQVLLPLDAPSSPLFKQRGLRTERWNRLNSNRYPLKSTGTENQPTAAAKC